MIKPYYENKQAGVVIYHADCREVLPQLARGSVDMILTDPPYGTGWTGMNTRTSEKLGLIPGDDGSLDVPACLALALRALKDCRHLYAFGRYDLTTLPLGPTAELIWDKCVPGPAAPEPWQYQHEYITFAVYVPSGANRAKGYGTRTARIRRGTVLSYPRLHSRRCNQHPTEKPVPLLRELIESSSRLGETVLDPFCGSGATLEAALLEGRKAIGIELKECWAEIAARRLQQQTLPLEVPV